MSQRAMADYTHEAADCWCNWLGAGAGHLLLLGSSFATLGVALRRRLAARKAEAGYRG